MKKILAVLVGNLILLNAWNSTASEPSSELVAYGEELFTTKKLGNKYECLLCHKGEKAIERAKVLMLGDKLPEVINDHLVQKSKGRAIAKESREMKALAAYIQYKHSI